MIASATVGSDATAGAGPTPAPLPTAQAWRSAAGRHEDLFSPLDPGARIGLLARSAPTHVLVWEMGERGTDAWIAPFSGYSSTAADIVLAADDESLAQVRTAAGHGALFEVLRAGIRSGHIVCYMLERRCLLEERGFDELLDALGFAFMGACR